jgi:EF-P beta-lysylation protein EpmB
MITLQLKKNGPILPSVWRQIQRENIQSLKELSAFLQWDKDLESQAIPKAPFVLNLPIRLARKIGKNTLEDPILKQFLPLKKEEEVVKGFSLDPVGDLSSQKESKLLHKYSGRALLIVSGACAMHCRYCFRKNFPYESSRKDFSHELQIIAQDPSIKEIILSGGDPLSLSTSELEKLLLFLEKIPHIKRIRFHTRFPIGIPERIDDEFLRLLSSVKKQIFFVIHTNHEKELDLDVLASLKKIQMLGIPVLSQSVLLQGINDSVSALKSLFETLADHGILPYYLHQLDKVSGSKHFEVPEEKGKDLMKELSSILSGYSLPKYAKEEAGKPSKTIISYY